MSIYLEDAQGNIISDPINETNTKYLWIPKNESNIKDANEHELDYQYMYNQDIPVSNIDTDVYDRYRNTVEELRTKTESYCEALESCLVPSVVKGMSIQPWEYRKETDSEGNKVNSKIKSLQYFFQDHASNISSDTKEFVFRTNKVKFIDDRKRRLIYDRTIHILSTKEDEENKVPFKDVLLRTFFTHYNGYNWCEVRDLDNNRLGITTILNNIVTLNIRKPDNERLVVLDENGEEKNIESVSDLDFVMQSGQDINTGIPSSLYNLYCLGWVHASMIFLNGLAIEWPKILISVDNIDTFLIIYGLREELLSHIDDSKDITLEYIYLPFKCIYMIGTEPANQNNPASQFLNSEGKFDTIPFMIDKRYGAIREVSELRDMDATGYTTFCDRVVCIDKNIVFKEFTLNSVESGEWEVWLPDIGIQFNQSFKDFCNNDYRTKIKQFNIIGFEMNKELNNEYYPYATTMLRTLKNDDFTITWHPFNILDIRFKHLYNSRRVFKVFYNTKVLYDQDNILRIKNHDMLSEEYERYRKSVTANIELYIREIYVLAKKDIGVYIANSDDAFMKGYKYHYVTPYECFLLYNAIQTLLEQPTVSFDNFRKINVINSPLHKKIPTNSNQTTNTHSSGSTGGDGFDYVYPNYIYDDADDEEDYFQPVIDKNDDIEDDEENYLGYMNGGFIVFDDEHNFFDSIVKEDTLYDSQGNLKEEIRAFWQSIIDADPDNKNLVDFLIPIDDAKNKETNKATESNMFYMYNGDNKGKVLPFYKFMLFCDLQQETDDYVYDYLKLRFELAHINNIEEGATPVDELIYYFDNKGLRSYIGRIINFDFNRYTENLLLTLAHNVFKYDPKLVMDSIEKMIAQSDYILPVSLGNRYRDDIIVTDSENSSDNEPETSGDFFRNYANHFYNYGYYDNDNIPRRVNDEWCLRRNLSEMFYWSLDNEEYVLDSMHLLDEVFDFTYGFDKDYEENLRNGTNYIIGYDADKLEASIKRGIVSFTKTGKELKEYVMNHPAVLYTNTDSYKKVVFNSNHDYIVTINDEKLYIHIPYVYNASSGNKLRFSYVDSDGIEKWDDIIYLRYKGQANPTIEINQVSNYIKDIDKDFTATYVPSKTKYNDETRLIEFYNNRSELVVTLQVDGVYTQRKLQMSRWNISNQENYVMIFKNRKLYDKYNTIHYSEISFDVDFAVDNNKDDDMYEFVFFLNANNRVITKNCKTTNDTTVVIPDKYYSNSTNELRVDANNDKMDKGLYTNITSDYTLENAISCNTDLIEPEYVQLLVSTMPKATGDTYKGNGANLAYELNHTVYSYKSTMDTNDTQRIIHQIHEDSKVNGLYRVTKQGGGEYFIIYDGTVPEKNDTIMTDTSDAKFIDHGYSTERTVTLPYKLYLTSKRQFRYQHTDIKENHEAGYPINLTTEFKYCVKNSHMMVFKNGLLLPHTYYFLRPIINTPIGTVATVINVNLKAGDSIDIFYVTNDLHHLECDYYDIVNRERYLKNGEIRVNSNGNEYRVMGEVTGTYYNQDVTLQPSYGNNVNTQNLRTNYIKLRSPLYAISSKNSTFIFLNGKKVRTDEIEDISDTIMSINTDYARLGEDMQAINLEVINHLDTQDIIERLYINDGLQHASGDAQNQFIGTNKHNAYKDTLQIKSFSITDLDAYAERTKLDKMLNDLSDKNLNKLFYNWNTSDGPLTLEGIMNEPNFVKSDVIIDTIIDEFYAEEDGDKFIWHTTPTSGDVEGQSNTVFYIGNGDNVSVPARWDDEATKALYGTTFNRNKTLRKIIIPEGVETIE